jgi:hypothetical protein
MSVSQPLSGQLPTPSNGNSAAPAGPTPVPLQQQQQQPHGQPPGIPIGPNMPPFDASRSPPSNKSKSCNYLLVECLLIAEPQI